MRLLMQMQQFLKQTNGEFLKIIMSARTRVGRMLRRHVSCTKHEYVQCSKGNSISEFPFTPPAAFSVHEYVQLSMSGSTGECPFADIITYIPYGVIHSKTYTFPIYLTILAERDSLCIGR